MFCCLYVLNDKTGITGFKKESCYPECPFYNHSLTHKCNIMRVVDRKLTPAKFGWMIHMLIQFPEDFNAHLGALKSAICCIHPAEQDIWIVQVKKNDSYIYRLHHMNKRGIDFQDLDTLSKHLSMKGYDGRPLTPDDFKLTE